MHPGSGCSYERRGIGGDEKKEKRKRGEREKGP